MVNGMVLCAQSGELAVLNFSNGTIMKKVDTMHEKEVTAIAYVEEARVIGLPLLPLSIMVIQAAVCLNDRYRTGW